MKNDLLLFERNILKTINNKYGTNYTYKNLRDGEKIYEVLGCYVSIKPNVS